MARTSKSIGSGPRGSTPQLWWIDDLGQWNPVDPESPLEHLSEPIGESPQHMAFAYRWLGMVQAKMSDGRVRFQWDVHHVHPVSLDAVIGYLKTCEEAAEIQLRFFFGAWVEENFANAREAAGHVRLTEAYRHAEPFPSAVLKRHDLNQVGQATDLIRTAFDLWRDKRNLSGSHALKGLSDQGVSRAALIFRRRPKDSALVYWQIGESSLMMSTFGPDEVRSCLGQRHSNDPNYRDSDNPVCEAYEEVLQTQQPRFDHIRAPVGAGEEDPYWLCYERLLLPCSNDTEEQVLVNLCSYRQDIGIPFMAGAVA